MIIIGIPKDIDNYICVNSKQCLELHEMGFIPAYRDLHKDAIYFLKTEKLCKVVKDKYGI